jgi:serine/threonine protein kinase
MIRKNIRKKTKSIFPSEELEEKKDTITLVSPTNQYTFDKQNKIGEGFHACIYKAVDEHGQKVALKIFDFDMFYIQESTCYDEIKKRQICSETILCIVEHFRSDNENYEYVIVMPLLENYMDLNKALHLLNMDDYEKILNLLTDAIHELNKNHIYHSDINESNIQVRIDPFDVKLIDFGNCRFEEQEDVQKDIEKLFSLLIPHSKKPNK